MIYNDSLGVLRDTSENLSLLLPFLIIPLFTYIAIAISKINRKVYILTKENIDYKLAFDKVNKELASLTSKNQEYKRALTEVNQELDALNNIIKSPSHQSINSPQTRSMQELDCIINKIGNLLEDSSV